jgi:cell fate (sporulation/competence/biofilm development) regulator YlbF (YheA/YmcA/DUF963 family)
MPVDTQQIMDEAEKLGQIVAQHPAVERYKHAQKAVAEDADASRLLADFERTLAKLDQQAQAGLPVTDAQRDQLEALQSKIVSHIKVKALNLAQVEFVDLLRRITQTIQKPLSDAPAGGAGSPKLAVGPKM